MVEKLELPDSHSDSSSDTTSDVDKEINKSEYDNDIDNPQTQTSTIAETSTDLEQLNCSKIASNIVTTTAPEIKSTTYSCKNCNKIFSRKFNLDRHVDKEVCTKISYACFKCSREFQYKQAYLKHCFFCE